MGWWQHKCPSETYFWFFSLRYGFYHMLVLYFYFHFPVAGEMVDKTGSYCTHVQKVLFKSNHQQYLNPTINWMITNFIFCTFYRIFVDLLQRLFVIFFGFLFYYLCITFFDFFLTFFELSKWLFFNFFIEFLLAFDRLL